MKDSTKEILNQLVLRYPTLACAEADVQASFEILKTAFEQGKRVYLCGNGGNASDCEHIAASF